ncbi:MAG TPA: BlaI/MecI/CopY family transcriptional regulator [Acidimicrobiales bacterium]|nr:BlaI/MecI/CopY family transcriptional regulator [Acidimicrobiales bacterium]
MARLGQLERSVMEAFWAMSAACPEDTFTTRDVAATLPGHAYTTVLTVVDRLTRKGLLERTRGGKSYRYRPTASRESYVAQLMHEALASTSDTSAALVRFVETVPAEQAELLRDVLGRLTAAPPQVGS